MQLNWTESLDEHKNTMWEASSNVVPTIEEAPFVFRIKQRLARNRIEWYDASDEDIRTNTAWVGDNAVKIAKLYFRDANCRALSWPGQN